MHQLLTLVIHQKGTEVTEESENQFCIFYHEGLIEGIGMPTV